MAGRHTGQLDVINLGEGTNGVTPYFLLFCRVYLDIEDNLYAPLLI